MNDMRSILRKFSLDLNMCRHWSDRLPNTETADQAELAMAIKGLSVGSFFAVFNFLSHKTIEINSCILFVAIILEVFLWKCVIKLTGRILTN